jgi:uncharacterized RDD family membrane protein YckC
VPCGAGRAPHILAIERDSRTSPVTANFSFASAYRDAGTPEPATRPDLFEGVLWRRAFAYLLDAVCIGAIIVVLWFVFLVLTVLSLGLLGPVLWFFLGLVPLFYHTLLVSGRHMATFGMRVFDLELHSWHGERPVFLQALAHTALFYVSVAVTGSLILLFALFNRRKQTLHDMLAGMVMIRRPSGARTGPDPWRR